MQPVRRTGAWIASAVLVMAISAPSLILVIAYRAQLRDLKQVIYGRCMQRAAYDQANHDSVQADVELYRQILKLQQEVPLPTHPDQRALSVKYRDAIVQAQARKSKAAAAGVVGSCTAYR